MEDRVRAFQQAAVVLPPRLRQAAVELPYELQGRAEEFRLRVGYPMTILEGDAEHVLGQEAVTPQDLEQLLERASRASVHTILEQLREGFVSVEGGHRVGFCGTTVIEQGEIRFLRALSSAAVRIARQFPGIAREVAEELFEHGRLQNTLIVAPPGGGKTSLLRDLIRTLSEGECGPGLRIGVADPRGELGASAEGKCQLDLGCRTDLLHACPKEKGIMLLLRTMNPQVIAVDEITQREDVYALLEAAGCGTALLATVHGSGREELEQRGVYRELLEKGIFRRMVLIRGRGGLRSYTVEVLR